HAPQQRHVGRARELGELRQWFDTAGAGRGSMVCISGEPGIGKTTLVDAFLTEVLEGHRCYVARGRCSERLVGADAYLPVLESLDSLLRGVAGSKVASVLEHVAPSWCVELAPTLKAIGRPAEGLGVEARAASQERKKREFVALLEQLSSERPIIWFLDDLHWADLSTVDLLSFVVPRCAHIPACILGTYRPSDLAMARHPFVDVKLELQTHRSCRDIELACLGLEDVEAYVALEFPGNTFPREFAAAIFDRTEGNPLFFVDLLRDLKNTGIIAQQNGVWELAYPLADARDLLPDSVRAMVERKIGRLNEDHRRLLQIASVEGVKFHSAVLARVLGIDAAQVEESLEILSEKQRLVQFSGQLEFPDSTLTLSYSFSHALYQTALYMNISPTRQAALSAAVAEALLAFHRGAEVEIASRLGYLYETARKWDRASEFLLAASRNAANQSANREAAALALRAIDSAHRVEDTTRDRHLLKGALQLAKARQALSEWMQSITDFDVASVVAAQCGDAEAHVEALCGSAISALYMKRTGEMRERTMRALEIAKYSGSGTAYPESLLGYHGIFVGDLAGARFYLERSVPVLRQRGASEARIHATTSLGFLHNLQSEYGSAESVLTDAIEQMQSARLGSDLLRAMWFQGMVLANRGRTGEALRILEKGMCLAELNGERYWYSRYPNTIGWVYAEMLDFESALRSNEEGVRAGREADTPEVEANSHINLANAYLALGQFGSAWSHLSECERILNRQDHRDWLRWRFRIRLNLEMANYWIARGELARAREFACVALSGARETLARKHAAYAHKFLGDIATLEERFEGARAEYEAALAILQSHPCPLIQWKVLLAAANEASLCRDQDRAERFFSQSAHGVASLAQQIPDTKRRQGFLHAAVLRREAGLSLRIARTTG
ncbi:MAG: AAA family ATPase, partial [Bryobacteraceae bacterium]